MLESGGKPIPHRRWGTRLFQRCFRLVTYFVLLIAADWLFRQFQPDAYQAYGQYFLLVANAFCAVTWLWLVARVSRHWRELKPVGFRYGSLGLLLAAGVLWSGVLAPSLFSFYLGSVSVNAIVPPTISAPE